ncbi:hypothetical protein ABI_00290 [Asticcacaulis biprosthecium C19]|uniref:DUF4365 domain-containing protein n=1 Tax=Asticcacaulis biprosthecium C19 TaxID=715226 RepID=F4QFY6_9CAUL|nr:DUF4365 domain-containing protein [Asticcacaulis biprosthecium]EGF93797.1 hypothetical protein ABI_00290 [Asticcacaulis biprosthecium C19]
MSKTITPNQLIGEIGEAAVRLRFLSMGFQFDGRSRLEAGIDGIAEVMDNGRPLARMIAVQVKATEGRKYSNEDAEGFTYLLKGEDLKYWKGSNLPVIVVLYRQSDDTFYWQSIHDGARTADRRLRFSKTTDILNRDAADRLAVLTVPKAGFGYFVPPLGGGEDALVNILPLVLPTEMFVASTSLTPGQAIATLLEHEEPARFDWVMKDGSFWSFHDPRESACRDIVDLDQVEAIETSYLAFNENIEEQNTFAFLLRRALQHQVREDLNWHKDKSLFYFRALTAGESRTFRYDASKNRTEAEVVNVATKDGNISFVRHHAFVPRFELILDQWYLIINPTYYFTTNGYTEHSYPDALLSGKKRMDNSSAVRGQVIMWHRFLTKSADADGGLFMEKAATPNVLSFGLPPVVHLPTKVPEDAWKTVKPKSDASDSMQVELDFK